MATNQEDVLRRLQEDPRVQAGQYTPAQALLRRRAAELRSQTPHRPQDEPEYPGQLERLAAETSRGIRSGLTLSGAIPIPSMHGGMAGDDAFAPSLGQRTAGPRQEDEGLMAYLGRAVKEGIDAEDIAMGAGYLIGSIPAILTTSVAAQGVAGAMALRFAGSASPALARAGQAFTWLSRKSPQESARLMRFVQGASRNTYEGLAYSLSTAPIRGVDGWEDLDFQEKLEHKAREIALETGIGAGVDFLLGGLLTRANLNPSKLIRKLELSDLDLDREMADQFRARYTEADRAVRHFDAEMTGFDPVEVARGTSRFAQAAEEAVNRYRTRTHPLAGVEGGPPQPKTPTGVGTAYDTAYRRLEFEQMAGERAADPRLVQPEGPTPGGPIEVVEGYGPPPAEMPATRVTPYPRAPEGAGVVTEASTARLTAPEAAPPGIEVPTQYRPRRFERIERAQEDPLTMPMREPGRSGPGIVPESSVPIIGRTGTTPAAEARLTAPEGPPGGTERRARPRTTQEQRDRTAARLRGERVRRQEAEVDGLTGLQGKEQFEQAAERVAKDPKGRMTIYDLRNFKAVNDILGEPVGDEWIKRAAEALKKAAREFGVSERQLFRHGGDEFAIIAPDDVAEKVSKRAKEIFGSQEVSGFPIEFRHASGESWEGAHQAIRAVKAGEQGPKYRGGAERLEAPAPPEAAPSRITPAELKKLSKAGQEVADKLDGVQNKGEAFTVLTEATSLRKTDRDVLVPKLTAMMEELPDTPKPKLADRLEAKELEGKAEAPPAAPGAARSLDELENHELGALAREHGVDPALKREEMLEQLKAKGAQSTAPPAAPKPFASYTSGWKGANPKAKPVWAEPAGDGYKIEVHRVGNREQGEYAVRFAEWIKSEGGYLPGSLQTVDGEVPPEILQRARDVVAGLRAGTLRGTGGERVVLGPEAPKGPSIGEQAAAAKAAKSPDTFPLREDAPAPVAVGKHQETTLPGGGKVRTQYRLVEADDLFTSHEPNLAGAQGQQFRPREGFPQEVQTRPYDKIESYQSDVATHASQHDPHRHVDLGSSAAEGPPVVRSDLVVVAGHERSMAQQILSPEKIAEKKAVLAERAADLGLDPKQVEGMRNPVLVRAIDDPNFDATSRKALQELNRASDTPVQKGKDPLAEANTRVRALEGSRSLKLLEDNISPEETVRQFLGRKEGREFFQSLVDEGIINRRELSTYFDHKAGVLTDAGRDLIEDVLTIAGIGDANVIRAARGTEGVRSVLQQMEHSMPPLLRTTANPDYNLQPIVREALQLHVRARQQGLSPRELLSQADAFADDLGSRQVQRMAEFLELANKRETTNAFRAYALDSESAARQLQSDDLFNFEPKTADQAFSEAFNVEGLAKHKEFFAKAQTAAKKLAAKKKPTDERGRQGFLTPVMLRPLAGGTVGALAFGYDAEPEDRLRLMMAGFLVGAGAATAPKLAAARRSPGTPSVFADMVRLGQKALLTSTDYMEKQGGYWGQRLARDTRLIDRRANKRIGVMMDDIGKVYLGLGRPQQEIVNKLVNWRKSVRDAPPELKALAVRLRKILDRDMNDWSSVGGTRKGGAPGEPIRGSGKAFPQVPNQQGALALYKLKTEGVHAPEVVEMARAMVDEGFAKDFDQAIKRLDGYREVVEAGIVPYADRRMRGMDPYLESTRFELPEAYVDWSPESLSATVRRNAFHIEGQRAWGPQHKGAADALKFIHKDSGADVAKDIERFLQHEFSVGGLEDRAASRLLGAFNNYETIVRLGYSPLSMQLNWGQQFTNLAHLPLKAQARLLRDFPPLIHRWTKEGVKLRRWAERSGHIHGKNALADLQGAPGKRVAEKAIDGFLRVVRSNETRSAIAARYALEADIGTLVRKLPKESTEVLRGLISDLRGAGLSRGGGGGAGAAARRLENLGLSNDQLADVLASGRRLTRDEVNEAVFRMVRDTQFPLTLSQKPIWWGTNPALRLAAKFKTFGVRQTGYIWKNVVREATKGNVAPMAKFVATTILLGELYHISRDLLVGSDRSITVGTVRRDGEAPSDIGRRVWTNLYRQGGVGMMMDLQYGISGWIGGPAASTLKNMGRAAAHILQRPSNTPTALWDLAREEVAASRQMTGLYRQIQRQVTDENQKFFEYQTWRERAWVHAQGERPIPEKLREWGTQTIEGRGRWTVGANSLSLHYAARAVQAGDDALAVRHLTSILGSATDRKERAKAMESIEASMRRRSPLGTLSTEDRQSFMRSLSPTDRGKIRGLENQWKRDYQRALNDAKRRARR